MRSLSLSKGPALIRFIAQRFLLRRFIFRLGFRSGFTHTKTTKCELALLKQHILLNVFAHINLFPTSTKCRQIESPQRLNA